MKVQWTEGAKEDLERLFSPCLYYAIPRWFRDLWFVIRMAYQRVVRGYDNIYSWGHYGEHARLTAKAIRILAKNHSGTPIKICSDKEETDEELAVHNKEWTEILNKIASGFEAVAEMEGYFPGDQMYDALKAKFDEGMKLYHEYYFNLWD